MDRISVSGGIGLPSTPTARTRNDFRVPLPSSASPPSVHPSLATAGPSFLSARVPDGNRVKLNAKTLPLIFAEYGAEIVKMARDVKWKSATSIMGKLLHGIAKTKVMGMRDDRQKMKDFIEYVANTGISVPNINDPALCDFWHCINLHELSLTIGFDTQGEITIARPGVRMHVTESEATASRPGDSPSTTDMATRAAAHVANAEIRRGNRRQSIAETAGDSEAMLYDFVRQFREEIVDSVASQLKKEAKSHPFFEPQIERALNNEDRVISYLTEICKVGACAEFSRMAHYYCVENATGTWSYHVAIELEDPHGRSNSILDHDICVLYEKKIDDPGEFDPDKAVVIDPWFNYTVSTLTQFMQGRNPFSAPIGKENMLFLRKDHCNGKPLLSAYVKDAIWRKTEEIHAREAMNIGSLAREYSNPNRRVAWHFDFPRADRRVRDLRITHASSNKAAQS